MTVLGQDCLLPLHYNGMQINACVTIHDSLQPVCYVDTKGWQVHVDASCTARFKAIRGLPESLVLLGRSPRHLKICIVLVSHPPLDCWLSNLVRLM